MRVVDDAEKRLRLCDLRQQAQHRQSDEVAVRSFSRREPERDAKRVGLRLRQVVDRPEHRPAELLQTRIRQVDLAFDADGADDLESGCRRDQLLEQCRLAHAGLAEHQERRARAAANDCEELLEPCELVLPPDERPRSGHARSLPRAGEAGVDRGESRGLDGRQLRSIARSSIGHSKGKTD